MQLNYFTAGLATLILASTSALAAPSPAPPAVVEPANFFKNAEAHGVDPYGPMPDDFTSFENGVYAFDAGSKFEMWVQAQLDLDPKEASVKKRQVRSEAPTHFNLFLQDAYAPRICGNNNKLIFCFIILDLCIRRDWHVVEHGVFLSSSLFP